MTLFVEITKKLKLYNGEFISNQPKMAVDESENWNRFSFHNFTQKLLYSCSKLDLPLRK